MTDPFTQRLAEIRGRLAKATGGLWAPAYIGNGAWCVVLLDSDQDDRIVHDNLSGNNAFLIAKSGSTNGNLALLLAVAEAAEKMATMLGQAVTALNSPEMNSLAAIAAIHGAPYSGPTIDTTTAREALAAYEAAKEKAS